MRYSFEDFDFSELTAPERLLLAQELLDSVFDAITLPRERRSEQLQDLPWEQVEESLTSQA